MYSTVEPATSSFDVAQFFSKFSESRRKGVARAHDSRSPPDKRAFSHTHLNASKQRCSYDTECSKQ